MNFVQFEPSNIMKQKIDNVHLSTGLLWFRPIHICFKIGISSNMWPVLYISPLVRDRGKMKIQNEDKFEKFSIPLDLNSARESSLKVIGTHFCLVVRKWKQSEMETQKAKAISISSNPTGSKPLHHKLLV